jgi:hypothetical protein
METVELTIAVGTAILIYKRAEITVWQEDLDSPFSFEFTLDGRKRGADVVATASRIPASHEERCCEGNCNQTGTFHTVTIVAHSIELSLRRAARH